MPEVVSDISPLQYLHQAKLLDLLPALYGHILVPQADVTQKGPRCCCHKV